MIGHELIKNESFQLLAHRSLVTKLLSRVLRTSWRVDTNWCLEKTLESLERDWEKSMRERKGDGSTMAPFYFLLRSGRV